MNETTTTTTTTTTESFSWLEISSDIVVLIAKRLSLSNMDPKINDDDSQEEFDLDTNLMQLGNCGLFPMGIYLVALFLVFMCPAQYMAGL